jgi:hypothetical protein
MMALVAALAAPALALDPGQTEFEHNGWYRYTNQSTKFEITDPSISRFALERGYVRLSHQWSSMFFTKFTVDMFSSDKYPEGATVRLKEAYADVALSFLKDFFLTAGLQKHYFGDIYSWDYSHPEKTLSDDRGVCASADYGLTLNGFLPAGLGELQLGVYNGEGYKYAGSYVNTSPELLGNLRLTPFAGVMVGFSAFTNASDRSLYKNDKKGRVADGTMYMNADTANTDRFAMQPIAKVALGPFSLTGTYLAYDYTRTFSYYSINRDSTGQVIDSTLVPKSKDYSQSGFDVMPLLTLAGRKLDVYGRYSMWERREQSGDSMPVNQSASFTRYGAGFNYHFIRRAKGKPGLELQLAWIREQAKKEGSDPKDIFMAQVRFEWNAVLMGL